jgi:hypothetical protein
VPWQLVAASVGGLVLSACQGERTAPVAPPITVAEKPLAGVGLGNEGNGTGACMGNDAVANSNLVSGFSPSTDPNDFNCTAKEVSIATATVTQVFDEATQQWVNFNANSPATCTEGSTVKLRMVAELLQNANSERQDIGVWIATDGGNAESGTCNHYNLPTNPNGTAIAGSGTSNADLDQCAGLLSSGDKSQINLGTLEVPCTPNDAGLLSIGSCIGWKVPADNNYCPVGGSTSGAAFRAGTLPSNKSKCNCEPFVVPIVVQKKATIEVKKACSPVNDAGKFNLVIGGAYTQTDAACGGTTGVREVSAGTNVSPGASYPISETAGTGTSLANYNSSYVCTKNGQPLSSGNATSAGSVTVQPNDAVVCTFTNVRKSSITITKVTQPASDPQVFAFTATGTGLPGSFSLDTDAASAGIPNTVTYNDLAPGAYTVTEGAVSGWDLASLSCTSNSSVSGATATITLPAGASVTCTYTNRKRASIIIEKVSMGGTGTFDFTSASNALPSPANGGAFSLTTVTAGAVVAQTFSNVVPSQSYNVSETVPAGWDLTSRVCSATGPSGSTFPASGTTQPAAINPAPGATVTCRYTNTKRATVTANKTENGGVPLSRAWTFEIRSGAATGLGNDGTVIASGSANLATGLVSFTCAGGVSSAICTDVGGVANIVPGNYQFCETGMPAGWQNNMSGFTPGSAPMEGADNSVECVNITLAAGASGFPSGITTGNVAINNAPPPGGDARTIGYWKNWSSCSSGNQYAKAQARGDLDRTLDYYLNGASTPSIYPIGDITGPLSCAQARNLLDKSDMNTGRKLASDPAYNLAAQFLAARLNYASGAKQCAAATSALAGAQALLDAINFVGTGSYRNAMTSSQATQANNFAATLDSYNNNTLACP